MAATELLGLEYVLLFGLPNNKLEVLDGRVRCSCPFLERDAAEAHYRHWLETLSRWKGVDPVPPIRQSQPRWEAEAAGFQCELYPRPINIRVPVNMDAFDQILHTYWWRDLWDGQPEGMQTGWGSFLDHQDVATNLWWLYQRIARHVGGKSGGRSDVVLTERSAVAPDAYLYLDAPEQCIDFFGNKECSAPMATYTIIQDVIEHKVFR